MEIASALMTCMIFKSTLAGRFGSFFLKKYISQMYKIIVIQPEQSYLKEPRYQHIFPKK